MPRSMCGRIRRAITAAILSRPRGGFSRGGNRVRVSRYRAQGVPVSPGSDPRVDGDPSDWDIVPAGFTYGTDMLLDVEDERNVPIDTADLDVRVRVGWVRGLNRLFFLYEAYDNYWDFPRPTFITTCSKFSVDADCFRRGFIHLDYPNRIFHRTSHAQNHLILHLRRWERILDGVELSRLVEQAPLCELCMPL